MIDVFICIIGIPVLLMMLLGNSMKSSASQWSIKKLEDRDNELKREFGSDDRAFFEKFQEDFQKRLRDKDEVEKIYQELEPDFIYAFGTEYRDHVHLQNGRIFPGCIDTVRWAMYLLLAKSGRWQYVGYFDDSIRVAAPEWTNNPNWKRKLAQRIEGYLRSVDPNVSFIVAGDMQYDINGKPTGEIMWKTGSVRLTDPVCIPSAKNGWLYKRPW